MCCQTCGGSSPNTLASPCVSSSFESRSLNRFDSIRRRQMVRLRKRSDWFLSQALGDGACTNPEQDAQCRLSSCDEAHPVEAHSSSITESSANPPSYFVSDVPQLCVNDSDVVDSETSLARQHPVDEGYSSRLVVAENSTSLFPTVADNSLSSPTVSTKMNSQLNASSESSPSSTEHLLQSDTQYFLVDRFYGGGGTVGTKAENGDA